MKTRRICHEKNASTAYDNLTASQFTGMPLGECHFTGDDIPVAESLYGNFCNQFAPFKSHEVIKRTKDSAKRFSFDSCDTSDANLQAFGGRSSRKEFWGKTMGSAE